jgi:hypothetical protein
VTKQHKSPVQPIPVPTNRFSHIHVDLVGPLPCSSGGYTHILTAVDRSTRWAEAYPLKNIATADCAAVFVAEWVARFGVPAHLTSDRGVQFTSAFWAAVLSRLGIQHKLTTAFHPQSNGAVERFHRRLKDALRARLATTNWPDHLPWIMLGLRAAPREDSGVSSAELVFGAPLVLPGQLLSTTEPPPEEFVRQLRSGVPCVAPLPPAADKSRAPPPSLRAATFVYVRSPPSSPALAPVYKGPYAVHRAGDKVFVLKLGDRFAAVSIDRLKPHLGSNPEPASPPTRGRPRVG